MNKKRFGPQGGFSVIEMMIVLVVLGILTTLAVLQFRGAKVDLERQRIAREFKIYLERARFDSVKRRAANVADMASVTLNGPSSFTARIDLDEDGTLRVGETSLVDFSLRSNAQILVSDTLNYPITIRFNQRGHVSAIDGLGNDVAPVFTICSDCSMASPTDTVIAVSTSGTVAVLRDGQSPDALPTPTTSNANTIFNCYGLVGNANTAGCIAH